MQDCQKCHFEGSEGPAVQSGLKAACFRRSDRVEMRIMLKINGLIQTQNLPAR
jgi:hypothetical protein